MSTQRVPNGIPAVNRKPTLRIVGWPTTARVTLHVTAPTEHAALALCAQIVGGEEVIDGVETVFVQGRQLTIEGTFACETQPDEITRLIGEISRHQFASGRV